MRSCLRIRDVTNVCSDGVIVHGYPPGAGRVASAALTWVVLPVAAFNLAVYTIWGGKGAAGPGSGQ